jgi:hypothetical protein
MVRWLRGAREVTYWRGRGWGCKEGGLAWKEGLVGAGYRWSLRERRAGYCGGGKMGWGCRLEGGRERYRQGGKCYCGVGKVAYSIERGAGWGWGRWAGLSL